LQTENAPLFIAPSDSLVQYTKRQMLLGHIFLIPFCYLIALMMRYVGCYQIENMEELRKQFKVIAKNNSPLIIASNHLTFIDSTLIIWAMASNFWYFFNYRYFSWNLPAGDVFKKKWYFRIVAYLGKCIFIHRDGTKEHKDEIISLAHDLVKEGEILTIFPEGRRSRSGRFDVDHITFGVGKIIQSLGECNVLCLYIRGDKQAGHSNYPPRGSKFRPLIKLIKVKANSENRRAYLEIGVEIAKNIKELENKYFEVK
jgi:1-acyl-sn-glycerol-3-phosphate acyltransferase